jgi:hypothetical protein
VTEPGWPPVVAGAAAPWGTPTADWPKVAEGVSQRLIGEVVGMVVSARGPLVMIV